jgi:flagellar biosynthesis/type III secretory pathway ATPase
VERAWNEDQEVLACSPAMVVRAPGTARVEIRLSAGTKIAGRVIDADGRGIEGALVSASQPGADASPGGVSIAPIGEPGREIRTDAEGRFEVPGLAPGRHVVVVSHPDFSGRRLEGVEAGRVDLVVTLDDAER